MASFLLFVALRYCPAPALALGFLGIYGATFLVHLLSFLILNGLLVAYGLLELGRGRRPGMAEGMLLLAGLVCLEALWSDSGPYRAMMADLANFHFRALAWPWVAMAAIISAAALIMVGRYWKRLQAICVLHPVPCLLVLAAMLALAFAVQALLLPPAAPASYQGDFWRFLIAESGNLVFALSFIRGGWLLLREDRGTASYGTAAAILMIMGAGVLLLSPWMGARMA
ncbi:hypothetical protein MIT9_P0489 [Methylomarinovum caldicuralii]|uniref:Uncharacterized protein n=1 Tax=Methylomarinovum caldicuralii TaxID=438856 RepID=A0AAU9CH49_9GAMM|nr:hypothetical protein [Methylomarinovum caldicuralii]BCX80911.1 hypothetical protein MIT9_P0489 [Methylomarinovum caldicuralii]